MQIQSTMTSIALEEYELMKDSKYRVYVSAVDKALKNFEYTSEWADLISALGKLNKVLLNHMKFPVIPRRIKISKRLAQCMHPALPSGVHLKALDTYDIIFKCMGTNRLSHELFIYSAGLFPLLGHAAMNVRPSLLTVYETHFVPLGERLRPGLSGFLSGVLPGLEEGSDHFERTSSLLEKVCDGVGPSYFYGCIWDCLMSNSGIRLPAITYVLSHFNKKLSMEDQLYIMGTNIDTMVGALCAGVQDSSVLVQRSSLDLLLVGFPMHNSQLLRADMVRLVTAALVTILRRDMSLNRRLFAWLLGTEVNISLLNSEHPLVKRSMSTETSNSTPYFDLYSKEMLIQAIKITLSQNSAQDPSDIRPYRILVSLLDKPDIGPVILDDILYEVFRTLYLACEGNRETVAKPGSNSCITSYKGSQELLKSANLLFSTLEPCYIWVYTGVLYDKACLHRLDETKGSAAASNQPESKFRGDVGPVGSGQPSLTEVCTLTEFLLDTVSLEAYMDTPSEHLPGLFLHVISKLTDHCDQLSPLEVARSLQLCAKILSRVQPSTLANNPAVGGGNKESSQQAGTSASGDVESVESSLHQVAQTKSATSSLEKPKAAKHKGGGKSPGKNKKSKFSRLKQTKVSSPVLVSISRAESEERLSEDAVSAALEERLAGSCEQLHVSGVVSGRLSPGPLDLGELRRSVSDADISSGGYSLSSDVSQAVPLRRRSVLEQCLGQYKEFYVKFVSGGRRVLADTVEQLFRELSVVLPPETDAERCAKLEHVLNDCLNRRRGHGEEDEGADQVDRRPAPPSFQGLRLVVETNYCSVDCDKWETPIKVASGLLVELSTFPTYCLPESAGAEETKEIPDWLKVLVVCASWLHHSPQLQLTAISTLLDLISLLRSQCEAAESAGHQGVVAVVMVPLLRSWHVSYIENHTNVVQVLARALWHHLGKLGPDQQVTCVELLHQLHNVLPSCNAVENVIGECLTGDDSESFQRFSLLWHIGRDVEAKASVSRTYRAFDRCLLKMLDNLQLGESCPLKLQTQSWLLHSLLRGDISRLLDPLLLILLDPATARMSVLHVDIQHSPTTPHQAPADSSCSPQDAGHDDDDDFSPTAKIYAISSVDGNVIYHVSSTDGATSGHRQKLRNASYPVRAKRIFAITTLVGRNDSSKQYVTEKNVASQQPPPPPLIVHPNHSISVFVNPFAASASSNTNSNDSATEDDSTATSSGKTAATAATTPDFVRKVTTRLNPLRKSVELVRTDKSDGDGSSLRNARKSKSAEFLKFNNNDTDEELSPGGLGKTGQRGFEGDNEDDSSSSDGSGSGGGDDGSECFEDVAGVGRRWSVGEDVLKGSLAPSDGGGYLNSNVSDSSSGNAVEAVLHEVLDKVVSQCDDNGKNKVEQSKAGVSKSVSSGGVHHLHSHMLLYCGVYDSSRTLYALHTLRHILLTNARMFLCAAATTGLANVSRGSPLVSLLSRHRKSVFGRNFHGDLTAAGQEFSGAYRSSMYLEVLMCACLYFARSFYPNLGQMRLTHDEIHGNRKVQLASAELLTLICSELIVIVRDSGKGFACFIADLLVRCKMQKVVLHCVLSSVHSMSSKMSGLEESGEKTLQRTFTEEIVDFNDPDSEQVDVHWKCKHRSSEQSEGFQVQLLRLLLALVMLEHQVNIQKGDSDAGVVTPKESGKTPNSPNQLKYLRGLVIPQQPMFLLAILTALKLEHMRHLHQHWTTLVTSALPFMGSSLTDLVMSVINQLCTNIENLANFYGSKEVRNKECCIPADYAVTQLEALTLLCHYCLLDSTQQQSLMFSQQLLGGYVSSLNIGVPSANPTQVFNNLVNVFMPMPQQPQDLTSNKDKTVMLDSHLSARRTVLGNMPRIIASVSALWQAVMTGNDWEQKSCVLGSPRVVKHHLLEFLSPISLHHGTNFLAAIAVAWQERRQETPPNRCNRRVVPVASPNQQVLVYLVGAIRALPMDTLVQTVNQVVKQPPPIEGAKQDALLEVSVLELFFCYMQTSSGSQLAESWASLVGLLRDGLSLSPPAQFLMLAILNEFVQKCPPLAEKKDLRDLQDITAKLVESCAQIAGACLEQTTWLRRNMAVREEEIEAPSLGKDKDSPVPVSSGQYSVQAQSVLAELLAPLLDVSYGSQEKERVVTILTALMYNVTPYLKNHSRRNVPSFYACSQLLASLSSYQYTRKAWRKDVFDLLLDPALFQMEANCLPFWRTVVDNLMTHDNTTFRDLMSRVSLAQSGSLSIFSSREQEYEQRAQLLKRLAFVILCSETDQYHKYMPEIQERLADSLRLPQVVPSIQAQVFLCFRVLLLRMSPQHVTSLWPVIVSELVQVFLHIEQELSTDTEQFSSHIRLMSALDSSWVVNSNNGLHAHGHPHWRLLQLSAAKLLDLALLLPAHRLPQFQMYRWAFVGSYDMDHVNDKDLSDEPPRPPDFVPHVTRIAHLMDHKFQVSVEPIPRQQGQLLLSATSINALQELHPFFTTLSQHHTLPPLHSTSQLESAIELDFLEKLCPR